MEENILQKPKCYQYSQLLEDQIQRTVQRDETRIWNDLALGVFAHLEGNSWEAEPYIWHTLRQEVYRSGKTEQGEENNEK